MRIAHFSDIHLSKENLTEFRNNYRDALINDLKKYHNEDKIDIIAITGDLVDKGGHSLKELLEEKESPYSFFRKEFVNPIIRELGDLSESNFLFVPGNHDIDESDILWVDEKEMKEKINIKNVNERLLSNRTSFTAQNKRIKAFKEFEKDFYGKLLDNYNFSNYESTYVYEVEKDVNVGFIMINDSWRCSTCEIKDKVPGVDQNKHFFGFNQLYDGWRSLEKHSVRLVICLFHHGLNSYAEKDEIIRFLTSKKVGFFLFGHFHKLDTDQYAFPKHNFIGLRGRAALNKPEEERADYQAGYKVIDVDINNGSIPRIHYRKYRYKPTPKFIKDEDIVEDNGIDETNYEIRLNQNTDEISDLIIGKLDKSKFKKL